MTADRGKRSCACFVAAKKLVAMVPPGQEPTGGCLTLVGFSLLWVAQEAKKLMRIGHHERNTRKRLHASSRGSSCVRYVMCSMVLKYGEHWQGIRIYSRCDDGRDNHVTHRRHGSRPRCLADHGRSLVASDSRRRLSHVRNVGHPLRLVNWDKCSAAHSHCNLDVRRPSAAVPPICWEAVPASAAAARSARSDA